MSDQLLRILLVLILALGTAVPHGAIGTAAGALKGEATYYPTCTFCAAASGELQAAIGKDWQDSFVTVRRGAHSRVVRLDTGCACDVRAAGWQPLIDLSEGAFRGLLTDSERQLGIAALGHIAVTVSWESGPDLPRTDVAAPTLPPTDVGP